MVRVDPTAKVERIREILPEARRLASACTLCARACGADRTGSGVGACGAGSGNGEWVRWQSAIPHFGEEPLLVGRGGSGAVFFSFCCLRCAFCQNWQISHEGEGRDHHYGELAQTFLRLQGQGVENINLVTPTQYILPILAALEAAYARGLDIPVAYNTGGYDAVPLIDLLDGVVDIWLPDLKYMASGPAGRLSDAPDYPEVARRAVRRMYALAGPLCVENGVAARGVIIRHLVLPEDQSGSYDFLLWLSDAGMADVTLSLMSQYSPQYRASQHPEIARPLARREYQDVLDFAERLGFENVLVQKMASRSVFLPDFMDERPFRDNHGGDAAADGLRDS